MISEAFKIFFVYDYSHYEYTYAHAHVVVYRHAHALSGRLCYTRRSYAEFRTCYLIYVEPVKRILSPC